MKKIFTTLLFAAGIYTATYAQTGNTTEFGVNVGYNSATVEESGSGLTSRGVSGFNLGVSADVPFAQRWSVKVKAIYDQKGWGDGYLIDNQGNEIDGVNFRLNYITIPVLATWHFGRTSNWYLHFGPYVGFLLNAKETNDNTDVKSVFNTTDAGIALGIGVKIPISDKAKFFIEYDGQGAFTNLIKNSDGNGSIQNIRESINVGISFPLQ